MRVYQLLVVAGAVALAGCDTSILTGSDCTESVDKTIDLDSPLPAVQLKIEACRVDIDACGALCSRVMKDNNLGSSGFMGGDLPFPNQGAPADTFIPFTKCAVSFEGTTTHVEVAYDQFNGGENCPVFDNVGAPGAGGGTK